MFVRRERAEDVDVHAFLFVITDPPSDVSGTQFDGYMLYEDERRRSSIARDGAVFKIERLRSERSAFDVESTPRRRDAGE